MPPPTVTDLVNSQQTKSSLPSQTSNLVAPDNNKGNGNTDQGASSGSGSGGQGSNHFFHPNPGGSPVCLQKGLFDGNNFNLLDDDNATVVYNGNWTIVTGNVSAGDFTQHETNSQNASIFAPFYGGQITVVGTVPNGTDNITASYSIDGAPPLIRSVPSNTECDIPVDPFFTMSGLTEGYHNITITVEQVGSRPYMFNFFALDPKFQNPQSDMMKFGDSNKAKKSDAGKIVGGVFGGLILVALICGIFFLWRRRRLCNVYTRNRANDARLQPQIIPPDIYSRGMQKQFESFGSSRGSFRDSTPAASLSLGQHYYGGGLPRTFGHVRESTPSWITPDTVSSQMRFSENPALPPYNIPIGAGGTIANANGVPSRFSPNTSMAFSPPSGKWDDIPVNDARTREMSQITEGQLTTATTPKSLNALASHFSPNTSVALSTPPYKWDDVFASVKDAAGVGTRSSDLTGQARGRIPSIIIEDPPRRLSSGHSAISGSEDGQGRAM